MGGGASVQKQLFSGPENVPINSWAELCQHQKPVEGGEELPLHLRGISGHLLWALVRMPEFEEEWTTGNFCHGQVLPLTAQYKCSFVRLAETLHLDGRPVTGTPSRFLSHTWAYPIRRTIRAALDNSEGGLDAFYWFDIFCLNQHSNEVGHPDFNSFLRSAMKQTGHTLFVCSPWNKPVSITRAWCLYEVMESLKRENEMTFTPVLDPEEEGDFTQALLEDTSALLEIFINVNARKASAYLKEDLEMIIGWIEDSVGLDNLNGVLKKGLCNWLRKAGTEAVDYRLRKVQAQIEEQKESAECNDDDEVVVNLQEEEKRLIRRKEILVEDLERFDHVEPLDQSDVLDMESVEKCSPLPSTSIPVLLGTTGHHAFSSQGGMCGGVLPAFLQVLVSQPGFRKDVHLGTDSQGTSKTSESRFHSELRNVCALWEKAKDGIISLDMLVDKLPEMSRKLSLQPSDFTEFIGVVLDENEALRDFWPCFSMNFITWYDDEDGVRHSKGRREAMVYIHTRASEGVLSDVIMEGLVPDEIEGYPWKESDSDIQKRVTVKRGQFWEKESSVNGRVAIMLDRFTMDYSTFEPSFNPAKITLPLELSMDKLCWAPAISEASQEVSHDDRIYLLKGIITYERHGLWSDEDTTLSCEAVFETYVEIEGRWWYCSEYEKVVRLVSWEFVQEAVQRSAIMVLYDCVQ